MWAEAGAGTAPSRATVTAPTAINFFMKPPLSDIRRPFDDAVQASVNPMLVGAERFDPRPSSL
jgi:hypothetical protein